MRKNIAIVFGGDSGEYDISVSSANVVARHLDVGLFNPYPILIKGKSWEYKDPAGISHPVDRSNFTLHLPGKHIIFNAVFMAIHGTPGEDGRLQAYFDLLGIPYTSSGQATSSLTFNKYFCNRFVDSIGVRIARSVLLDQESTGHRKRVLDELSLPVFIKPNNGGSSVGTSRVNNESDLETAIERAFREDSQVLVEEYIRGREITCGVITYKGSIRALPLTEIISQKEFFDYEAKYQGKALEVTPADIPTGIADECRRISVMLYRELNCKGMVRIDYIFNDSGLFFLEVNTVPGLSEASIVPQQAAADGITLKELFTDTVLNALGTR